MESKCMAKRLRNFVTQRSSSGTESDLTGPDRVARSNDSIVSDSSLKNT